MRRIQSGSRFKDRIFFGQIEVFTGISQVFANRDDGADAGFAGPLQNRIPIVIKVAVTDMGVGVH